MRGLGDVTRLVPSIRAVTAETVPGGFISGVATIEQQVDASLVRERMLALLATFFAALALILACVGLYGVMAYGVVRRTREIGIRIAIGARQGSVIWMMVRETLLLVSIGAVLGTLASLAANTYLAGQLFGVTPRDPFAIGVADFARDRDAGGGLSAGPPRQPHRPGKGVAERSEPPWTKLHVSNATREGEKGRKASLVGRAAAWRPPPAETRAGRSQAPVCSLVVLAIARPLASAAARSAERQQMRTPPDCEADGSHKPLAPVAFSGEGRVATRPIIEGPSMQIRTEQIADIPGVHALNRAASSPTPRPGSSTRCAEKPEVISLVAEKAGHIVGHIMFRRCD